MKRTNTSKVTPAPSILRAWRCRAGNESGGTLVETAFVLTFLFTLLFGIIQISWALYAYHFVSDAAREGTRYAMVRGSDWTTSSGSLNYCDGSGAGSTGSGYTAAGCVATVSDIQAYVTSLNFPGVNLTSDFGTSTSSSNDVIVEYYTSLPTGANGAAGEAACPTSGGASASTATPAAGLGNIVQVTVTYPFSFGIPGLKSLFPYSLCSTSQMTIAQ